MTAETKKLGNQEVLDTVLAHLVSQRYRAITKESRLGNRTPAYKGSEGTSCAIGCMIPDEMYDPAMEGQSVGSLLSDTTWADVDFPFRDADIRLLTTLQCIHDSMRTARDWRENQYDDVYHEAKTWDEHLIKLIKDDDLEIVAKQLGLHFELPKLLPADAVHA